MGFRQVLDVYVVPDARAVRRRVVRPVNQKLFGFTLRCLERPGDQVCGLLVCLSYPAARVCARHVKIAQGNIVKSAACATGPQAPSLS